MKKVNKALTNYILNNGLRVRPGATAGAWVMPLLPIAVALSAIKYRMEASSIYKYSAVLSFGILLSSLLFIYKCICGHYFHKIIWYFLTGLITTFVLLIHFRQNLLFSIVSGLLAGPGYYKALTFTVKKCPQTFTLGEASVIVQGIILFIYSSIWNIHYAMHTHIYKVLDTSTLIIQIGLLGVGLFCLLLHYVSLFRRPFLFYTLLISDILFAILLPLYLLLRQNPLMWILSIVVRNIYSIKLFFFWLICSFACGLTVYKQINGGQRASTSIRKIFHLLVVAVYLPGLVYECSLLYTASGIILGILVVLEVIRIVNVPPFGSSLHEGFLIFFDEKDAGGIALTPIYLLIGSSLPLWIHPTTCDITDSSGFYILPLLSGILSIGIGDTTASVIGSTIGTHKWPGTKKTVEGTLACIVCQVAMIFALVYFDFITRGHRQIIRSFIAIIITSLIEATTTQVDNLVLPLIMYIILL